MFHTLKIKFTIYNDTLKLGFNNYELPQGSSLAFLSVKKGTFSYQKKKYDNTDISVIMSADQYIAGAL